MRHSLPPRACALFLLVCMGLATSQAHANPTVHLSDGDLIGMTEGGVEQYRGIRYAQAPVGPLRWAAPKATPVWSGQRDATQFGAACPQQITPFSDNLRNSEDCLFLNVYVPEGSSEAPRPVIVWIPGGGMVLGSARQYDASRLAQVTQSVVVTLNYRLGALGYLWTSGMAAENKGHNFSLQDQQEAMRWVKRNIAGFNADPARITMAGQSVGSISGSYHLTSPQAAGLFDRAILASGIAPPGLLSSAQAAAVGDAFAVKAGCAAGVEQMDCLRGKSPEALVQVSPSYFDIAKGKGLGWSYFIDGDVITGEVLPALSKGHFNKVPVMVGSTKDEGRGFVPATYDLDGSAMTQEEYVTAAQNFVGAAPQPLLTDIMYPSSKLGGPTAAYSQLLTDGWFACPAYELAQRASSHVPVYAYEFADRTAPAFFQDPFLSSGAFHASDLLYWFQTPIAGAPLALNPAQKRLSDEMMRFWGQFAASGRLNDNPAMGTVWPKFSKSSGPVLTLVPDAITVQQWGAFPRAHQCTAWSLLTMLKNLGAN
jgi:para-nitrobenzyl esterase